MLNYTKSLYFITVCTKAVILLELAATASVPVCPYKLKEDEDEEDVWLS